jgi:2-isopropylmalate synthase
MLKIGGHVRDHAPRGCGPRRHVSLPLGKHSGRAALRAKLKDLGFEHGRQSAQRPVSCGSRPSPTARRRSIDDDLIALVTDSRRRSDQDDHLER